MGETNKAHDRRLRDNWFAKYAPEFLPGLDISEPGDFLNQTFRRIDAFSTAGTAAAFSLSEIKDHSFFSVHCGHVLEHFVDPLTIIQELYRLVMVGGHLILCVPHRDLYEKRKELPSQWNADHKTFWIPENDEPPYTLGLKETILRAIPGANIVSLRVLDEGFQDHGPSVHSQGEYSIEAIVKRH